jgi:hypothetical protein
VFIYYFVLLEVEVYDFPFLDCHLHVANDSFLNGWFFIFS